MSATIIQFPHHLLQRTVDHTKTRLLETQILTAQLRDMCSETINLADSLADGLSCFSRGIDDCLIMLADGAERQKQVMSALDSGDLAEMERCRDSMLQVAAGNR